MSFAQTAASALPGALSRIPNSLGSVARAIGVIAGASILAAGHQIAYEESRGLINYLRQNAQRRRVANAAVILFLSQSDFPVSELDDLRRKRDAVKSGLVLLTSSKVELTDPQRETLRKVLIEAHGLRMVSQQAEP